MSPTRREALIQLAALAALPRLRFNLIATDPLDGTIADYQAGRRRGEWSAAEITARALDRCRSDGAKWHAIDALADSALIEGPLLASRGDGSRVTYLGREDFDGTLAYKLKVTQKDGDEFVYWLDPDTWLEIKVDETRRIRGAAQTTETELGDYEKVAGVYFPMSVESWPQGQQAQRQRTIIASGVANAAVSDAYFAEPRGTATSTKAAAEPADVSSTEKGAAPSDKPAATKKPPVNPTHPPKGK